MLRCFHICDLKDTKGYMNHETPVLFTFVPLCPSPLCLHTLSPASFCALSQLYPFTLEASCPFTLVPYHPYALTPCLCIQHLHLSCLAFVPFTPFITFTPEQRGEELRCPDHLQHGGYKGLKWLIYLHHL